MGALLVAQLAFMPAAFGAVEAWSELVVVAIGAILAIFLAIWFILRRNIRPIGIWAWIPLLLFAALVAFQQVAWPKSLINLLSPTTISTRQDLLGDGSLADPRATISLYPLATTHGLRMLFV